MIQIDTLFGKRLTIGKTLGFLIGLLAFFVLWWMSDASLMLRLWVLFWYTTFGIFIALVGIMDEHPALHFSMPFWFRGIVFGGWINFVLVLVAYPVIAQVFSQLIALGIPAFSPFLLVIEWMLIGLFIDFICSKYAGEGTRIVEIKKRRFGIF